MVAVRRDSEGREKVWDLIRDIKVALMVTRGENDKLHARPMVAVLEDGITGENWQGVLWFMARIDSPKIEEIARDSNVLLSYSEPKDQNYVALSGTAEVLKDTNKVKELWSEHLRTWFPHGPEESDLVLIRVTTESAEYWDTSSSAFIYAYGYVKARLTGESPKMSPEENAVVDFEAARQKRVK